MEFAACVGWDWAEGEHVLSESGEGGSKPRHRSLRNTPEALHEWASEQLERHGGRRIAVCIEAARGAVIHAFMQYPHIVLYPVNPKSVSSLREALYPSGKKDDPVDAEVLRLLVEVHADKLRRFEPSDETTRTLTILTEHRRKIVQEIVRATNRLRAVLRGYFPQALDLVGDLDTQLTCDFLERWTSLEAAKRARRSTLEQFYRQHNCRSAERIEERVAIVQSAIPLTTDRVLNETGALQVRALISIVRSLLAARKDVDETIETSFHQHADFELISSLPGAGPVFGPRLCALLGSDRTRFTDAEQLQLLTGIAPVTKQSGGRNGTRTVLLRRKRSRFLHQTVLEWAGHSVHNSVWAKATYDSHRARGSGHYAALRALAFKWLRVLYACWSRGELYSEERHLARLRARGSSLALA